MKNIRHGILVKDGLYNSFPSIVRAGDGRLVMVFRQAENRRKEYGEVTHVDPSSRVMMTTSKDDGETWDEAGVIYDDEMGEQDPCLTCLKDGTLICTFFRWRVVPVQEKHLLGEAFEHYGRIIFDRWAAVHQGTVCIRSSDCGRTWDGPWKLEPTGFQGPAALRGNIVELSGGRLLAPLYGTKRYGDTSSCSVVCSEDKGSTWRYVGEVPGVPEQHFLEPFLYRAPSGRLDMLMRTQRDFRKYPFDETYMQLHVASSLDEGVSWSLPEKTSLFCPNPVHVLPISQKKILVTYGQRRDPKGIEALVTDPESPGFSDADVRMLRPAESSDLGYTSAVGLCDGSVLVVYYMTDTEKDTCIGATRVEV